MKTSILFIVCVCFFVTSEALNCALTSSDDGLRSGKVNENAAKGTEVTTLAIENDGTATYTLLGDVAKYFEMNKDVMVVKNSTLLDRLEVGLKTGVESTTIKGEIQCSSPNNSAIGHSVEVIMHYTNKEDPVIITDTLPEQSEYVGIGTVIASINGNSGDDVGEKLTYSITEQDPEGVFSISSEGELSLEKDLDYNIYPQHTMTIGLTDEGIDSNGNVKKLSTTKTITIDISDYDNLPPVFESCGGNDPPFYTANITTNETFDDLAIKPCSIQAKDGDTGIDDAVEYSLTSGSNDFANYFEIDSDTGQVNVIKAVDTPTTFLITVKAAQKNRPERSVIAYLQIEAHTKDDNKPKFEKDSFQGSVTDDGNDILFVTDTDTGSLLQVKATDADPNSVIVYVINPPGTPFQISSDGYIFARNLNTARAIVDTQVLNIKAINTEADPTSPNRDSDVVTVEIDIMEVTTQATTIATTQPTTDATTFPDTTAQETTEQTTVPETTTVEQTTQPETTTVPETTIEPTTDPTTIPETTAGTEKTTAQSSTKDGLEETASTNSNTVEIDVRMVPASTLYGVAGGLSAALLIALLIITYLMWERRKKKKANKQPLVNPYPNEDKDDNKSGTGSSVYQNGAYTEEDEVNTKATDEGYQSSPMNGAAHDEMVTDLDAQSEQDPTGLQSNDEFHADDYAYSQLDEDGEGETSFNDNFDSEPQTQATGFHEELLLASAAIAATSRAREPESKSEANVNIAPRSLVLSHEIVQEEETIKEDLTTSVKIVTLKGYGDDGEDVKAVQKSIDLSMATSNECKNARKKIALMEQVSDMDRPNILKYYGSYENDDMLHYVNAYAENGSLHDKLKSGQLNPNSLMHIVAGIGTGLQYLHAKNITHGRLWSKSVMLSADNTAMLTDIVGDDGPAEYGEIMRWQAIEIIGQTSPCTPASDVWSYGTLMWEIVSQGALPYADVTDLRELLGVVTEQKLSRPKQCSESLFSIMETCWKTSPELRPDMYVINANLSEKLLEDSNEHIGLGVNGNGFDDDNASQANAADDNSDADYTAF